MMAYSYGRKSFPFVVLQSVYFAPGTVIALVQIDKNN